MAFRTERIKSAIMELAAEFLNRRATSQSLITVIDCELAGDNREAKIVVSVFPPEQGKTALAFLKRLRGDLYDYLLKHLRAGKLPLIDFVLDSGDKW